MIVLKSETEQLSAHDITPYEYALKRLKELKDSGQGFVLVCPTANSVGPDEIAINTISNMPFDLQREVLKAVIACIENMRN